MNPINLYPSQCFLAEGPYWHAERGSFFWVDIEKGRLFEYHLESKKTKYWDFPHRLAVVLEAENGKLILGLDRKLAYFDLETEELEFFEEVEKEQVLHRFNDGKVDPVGRVWIGTLSTQFTPGAGKLYCLEPGKEAQVVTNNLTISNGMAWTEDQKTFYFIDSPTQEIRQYAYDAETGEVTFDKVAIKVPKSMGTPDGMCLDRNGRIWVAHYAGSGVYCWDPKTGELLDQIQLPVPHVTSCCFGGENLDHLLITTAQENLDEDQLKQYPESGDVFLVKTETQGYLANKAKV